MITWLFVLLVVCIVLLIPTAYAGLIGAPYVPTRQRALKRALAAVNVGSADLVVDIGCGDGGVLLAAARRGARSVGFELSPILWAVAQVRAQTSSARPRPRVRFGNFYQHDLPRDTTIIFFFLMPKALPRLRRYLQEQQLLHAKYVLSYTFALPSLQPQRIIQTPAHGTVYVYSWEQIKQ